MPLDNLISLEFSDDELKEIDMAFKMLEKNLNHKMVNLTPQEKKKYGRPGPKFMPWIKKIVMYMKQNPELTPTYMNKEEFLKDVRIIEIMTGIKARLALLNEAVDDTNILVRKDLHQAGISYYRHLKLVAKSDIPGSTSPLQDLEAIFKSRKGRKKPLEEWKEDQ